MGPGAEPQPQPPALEELLAAAARPSPPAPDAEANALAAFRAARDEGALDLPTRPEDDWRPAEPRRRSRLVKTGLGTLVAGVMFGGVAMAAGSLPVPFGGSPSEGPGPVPTASPSVPDGGSESATAPVTESSGPPDTPAGPSAEYPPYPPTAEDRDRAAHCRAYDVAENDAAAENAEGNAAGDEGKGRGRGKANDSAVRERLEAAAGGADAVEAYCAGLLTGEPADIPGAGSDEHPGGNRDAAPPAGAGQGGEGYEDGHGHRRGPGPRQLRE